MVYEVYWAIKKFSVVLLSHFLNLRILSIISECQFKPTNSHIDKKENLAKFSNVSVIPRNVFFSFEKSLVSIANVVYEMVLFKGY